MKIEVDLVPDSQDEDGEPILVSIEEAVAQAVTTRIARTVEKHVMSVCTDEISARIKTHITEWVDVAVQKPVQKTDNYGHAKGEPISFEEYIGDVTQRFLVEKVNTYGEHRGGGGDCHPRIDWIIRAHADALVKKELAAHLKAHREHLAKALGDIVTASATAIKVTS